MAQQIDKGAGIRKTGKERFLIIMKGFALLLVFTLFALIAGLMASTSSIAQTAACSSCHGVGPHGPDWAGGCSTCHDSPPQTGTHLTHYGSAPLAILLYSSTSITSTDGAYRFGCGNCHPLDFAKHNNGTVDVELYNANSPAGSLKAKNPSNAAYVPGSTASAYVSKISGGNSFSYSNGTCNNIYCHSGYTVTSGPVGDPLVAMDPIPTYDPYTVTYSRVYKTTPQWGTSGTFSACTECHEFPLTTSAPSVQAGVGDSHQWIDDYGYGNLHAYNMGFDPISCRTCHYGIVTQANTWIRANDVTIYDAVPLASRKLHVNGTRDVILDTVNPVTYASAYSGTTIMSLASATYAPATKTCSTVACHQQQTSVQWGKPYRWWDSTECNLCHSY